MSDEIDPQVEDVQPDVKHPSYLDMTENERTAFLAQIGNVQDSQRLIFNLLCDNWEPEINYRSFVDKAEEKIRYAGNILDKLMGTLMSVRCGVVFSKKDDKQMVPESIILRDRNDIDFFFYFLRNVYQEQQKKSTSPYPTLKAFEKKVSFPTELSTDFDITKMNREALDSMKNKNLVLKIFLKTIKSSYLICPSRDLTELIRYSSIKLRYYLSNDAFSSMLAKIMQSTLGDLQKNLNSSEPVFWGKVGKCIMDNRDDFISKGRLSQDSAFIHAAEIIYHYSQNQVAESEKKRLENEEKKKGMQDICSRIQSTPELFMLQENFNKLIEPLNERFPGLKDDFFKRFTESKSKIKLPELVFIQNYFIHRDNMYPLFFTHFDKMHTQLRNYYVFNMEKVLKTGNKVGIGTFTNKVSFQMDIENQIKEQDPFLFACLKRPRIISEAIIHNAKSRKKIKDIEKIKQQLEKFFKKGRMEFLDIDTLMNLVILDVFEEAFNTLPVFKQLIIRIMGRYESYKERYTGLEPVKNKKKKKMSQKKAKPQQVKAKKKEPAKKKQPRIKDDPLGLEGSSRSGSAKSSAGSRVSSEPKLASSVSNKDDLYKPKKDSSGKAYTKGQQEDSWKSFNEALSKD